MFDVFDVVVPALLPLSAIEVRQCKTAFGVDERRYLYLGEVRLAHVLPAHAAYSNVRAGTGSAGRDDWIALALHDEANAAVINEETWAAFLGALQTLLMGHLRWRVRCESDCDQHPLERFTLAPDAL